MTVPANVLATTKNGSPGPSCENGQATLHPTAIHVAPALSALPDQARVESPPMGRPPGRVEAMRQATLEVKAIAETLTDIERVRIAAENRHRSWVQGGMGGTAAAEQAALIATALKKVEDDAALAARRALRKHPLAPFVKNTVGIGEKQGARLLAAVEDPYWNALYDRPRRGPAELWAYCGLHVLHPGHARRETHRTFAGVDPSAGSSAVNGQISRDPQFPPAVDGTLSHPGHASVDAHGGNAGVGPSSAVTGRSAIDAHVPVARDGISSCGHPGQGRPDAQSTSAGVAARRTKGQKANWSNEAKMRARLCAESCVKQLHKPCAVSEDGTWAIHVDGCTCSPYRLIYDTSKQADAGKGLTPLHVHNRALRKAAKALLKDMWRAARDWHQEAE